MTEQSRQQDSNRWRCALGEQSRGTSLTQENLALYGQCPYADVQEVIDHGGEGEAY